MFEQQILQGNLSRRILTKLRTSWHRWRFSVVARRVRHLKPLYPGKLPFVLLSMVQSRDVDAYLIAVHSFYRYVPAQRVVTVCDPSITSQDRNALRAAIPHVELVYAADFRHPELPVGGTWERLQAMAHFARDAYVVQLDADTVTNGPLPEVIAAIQGNRAFILGEEAKQKRLNHAETCENARQWQASAPVHIQALCEFLLPNARVTGQWYVRGCAGFFGMPQSQDVLARVRGFAKEMQRLTGARWAEWGTEQVTVNYITAQHSQFELLPWPAYATPQPGGAQPLLGHFIGSIRFASPQYRQAASSALRTLRNSNAHGGDPQISVATLDG